MIACPHYSRDPGNNRHGNCALGLHAGRPWRGQCLACLVGGPGTELKRLLAWWGIQIKADCPCQAHAAKMDREGPVWCRANITTIVGWMAKEARDRRMVFVAPAARLLVWLAIWRAEKRAAKTLKNPERTMPG